MQLELVSIKHSEIIPNDWNPNKQNERAFQAEIESITDNGFVQPMTVRKHPTQKSKYQIIDGYHRWLALQKIFDDSKLHTAPLKAIVATKEIPCVVIDVTEAQAKKLTIILNETRGRAEIGELGMLLESIQIEFGDDLIRGLPYSQGQLDDLLSLAEFDWENLEDLAEDEDTKTELVFREKNMMIGNHQAMLELEKEGYELDLDEKEDRDLLNRKKEQLKREGKITKILTS